MLKRTPSLNMNFSANQPDEKLEVLETCYPPPEIFEPPNDPRPADPDPIELPPDKSNPDEDQIQLLANRVVILEYQLSAVINLLQQTTMALSGFEPIGLIEKPPIIREKILQLVDGYAFCQRVDHQEVWRILYNRLKSDFNFDVWIHRQAAKGSLLDVVESYAQLRNLYSLALSILSPAILAST